jgi:hypothetical protein
LIETRRRHAELFGDVLAGPGGEIQQFLPACLGEADSILWGSRLGSGEGFTGGFDEGLFRQEALLALGRV